MTCVNYPPILQNLPSHNKVHSVPILTQHNNWMCHALKLNRHKPEKLILTAKLLLRCMALSHA